MDVPADYTCLLSDKPATISCSYVVLLLETMGPVLWYYRIVGGGADDAGGCARHGYNIGMQILYPDKTLHEKLVITPVSSCCGNYTW